MKRLLSTLVLLCAFTNQAIAFDVPFNDGYVTDTAHILTEQQDAQLEDTLRQYKESSSNEIAILIIPSLEGEDISEVATEVGRSWGIGTKEYDNGILILVSYEEREIFIATGYGLEGAVPDIVAKGIIDTDIVPSFREGNYYEGLMATIVSLQKHIGGEYTVNRYENTTEGGTGFIFFFLFIFIDFLASLLGKSKSWWLGGIVGAFLGIVLVLLYSWWWSIPLFSVLGLLFDYFVSKTNTGRSRRNPWIGSGRGGGTNGGGGFGGFGGGSFGGGGARGKW